jgi:hypothetical protein
MFIVSRQSRLDGKGDMDEYTMALCLLVFGTVCVVIGWAIGRVEAGQKYKTRLRDQHHQILDLYKELDKEIDKAHDIYLESQAEMKRMGVEPLTFEEIYGSKQ